MGKEHVVKRELSEPIERTEAKSNDDTFLSAPSLPEATQTDESFEGGPQTQQATSNPNEPTKSRDELRGTLSSGGEPYDPAIHAWPATQTRLGKWRARRVVKGAPPLQGTQTPTGMASNLEFRKEAQQMADLYGYLNFVALGEGAEPKAEEVARVTDAVERWYQRYGIVPLHPIVGLVAAMGGYTYTVATRPKVRANGRVKRMIRPLWIRFNAALGRDVRTDDEKKAEAA